MAKFEDKELYDLIHQEIYMVCPIEPLAYHKTDTILKIVQKYVKKQSKRVIKEILKENNGNIK